MGLGLNGEFGVRRECYWRCVGKFFFCWSFQVKVLLLTCMYERRVVEAELRRSVQLPCECVCATFFEGINT